MDRVIALSPGQYFITGTDTDVGKTYFTCHWLQQLAAEGYQTTALKPMAAGAVEMPEGLRNADALELQASMTEAMLYEHLNPVCYPEPVSPHLAAPMGQQISAQELQQICQPGLTQRSDYCLVEGAGGWLCPMNAQQTLADFVQCLNIPVVLVVGMRLGCLNHALLTVQDIHAKGLILAGWVANGLEKPMPRLQDNIATLQQRINAPCLAIL